MHRLTNLRNQDTKSIPFYSHIKPYKIPSSLCQKRIMSCCDIDDNFCNKIFIHSFLETFPYNSSRLHPIPDSHKIAVSCDIIMFYIQWSSLSDSIHIWHDYDVVGKQQEKWWQFNVQKMWMGSSIKDINRFFFIINVMGFPLRKYNMQIEFDLWEMWIILKSFFFQTRSGSFSSSRG